METTQKIRILRNSAKYDICSSSNPRSEMHRSSSNFNHLGGIYYSSTPRGCSALFKTLLSNKCLHNCSYCANAKYQNIARASIDPEALAATFIQMYKKRIVQGLFLSSAVEDNPEKTMAKIIKTTEIVRYKHNFGGFIHLKIMPGTSEATAKQACKLASRASINIEAPTENSLNLLSKTKKLANILKTINILSKMARAGYLPSGQTTQFMVGAAKESDQEIIKTSENLYKKNFLRRIYFSAFSPIEGTSLQGIRRANPLRQHRLYQCDFLMREYGFKSQELVFSPKGQLPLDSDPKMNFALLHPELFPVEINSAPQDLLLKVPGIGPKSAERIIKSRHSELFREIKNLVGIGIAVNRAKPFILINGKKQGFLKKKRKVEQLKFHFSLN